MLGDAMQPVVSYRTTMNSVWLVYLAQAFVATIRQRSCYSTQTCLYLLSAEQSVSPKRPRICVRPLTPQSLNRAALSIQLPQSLRICADRSRVLLTFGPPGLMKSYLTLRTPNAWANLRGYQAIT